MHEVKRRKESTSFELAGHAGRAGLVWLCSQVKLEGGSRWSSCPLHRVLMATHSTVNEVLLRSEQRFVGRRWVLSGCHKCECGGI